METAGIKANIIESRFGGDFKLDITRIQSLAIADKLKQWLKGRRSLIYITREIILYDAIWEDMKIIMGRRPQKEISTLHTKLDLTKKRRKMLTAYAAFCENCDGFHIEVMHKAPRKPPIVKINMPNNRKAH